ncbi:MAG: chemotaxis protein CheB, partial [Chloroflexota bacterium]
MATAKKRSPGQPVDQLVVLGASAGGIEAVSVVLSDLPSDFPAPIVVAQHLHPDHHSNLPEILSRQTDLRVVSVEEEVKLEAATVYLVPPNRHVEITDHAVRLQEFGGDRPKPSIDHLLATAAETFGERLVAVILSGTGSDGAAGAEDVAAAGGTVIAQDPDTATFPSMPRSLSRAIVDAVRPLEQIGALLVALVTGERTLKADDDERLSRFLETLRDRSGVDFTSYKQPTVLRRIQRRMIATGSDGLAEYRRHLLRNPDEIHR